MSNMKNILRENSMIFLILSFIVLEGFFFYFGNKKANEEYLVQKNRTEVLSKSIKELGIEAKAVSVYDDTTGEKIYGKNDEEKMPIASLTKIMTAIVALNNKEEKAVITKDALRQETDYGFLVGEKFDAKELIKFTLIGSVNDSAYALAENIPDFLQKMNLKAKKIGMENAEFLNSTGLDMGTNISGGYASASDVNTVSLYAFKYHPEIFGATVQPEMEIKSESGLVHKIENTDLALGKIPNILFSKTGYTPLAGGNLSVIFKDKGGHIIAATVLGSTMEGRFSDMEKITEVLYNFDYEK